ncbi:autotransporter outer membrane beta-barrel domain-containing protein [Enterobacter quasiroggenkampii]|uniref:autotransporter outer membrane beta-barrel domain-containing protein n=1 Tax=Enterobacter quasiroggenkampii TaxID=2497436 RepID=UPI0020035998|nr:autotransporter outer membrane beta-barrel domain-containing protein [Enterobacter quasiroggenkampii]MCK7310529.1 hypothetical protein [Enterobacter quasiroggenkampii]
MGNKHEGDGQENILDKDVSTGAGEIGNLVTGNNTDNTISGNVDVSGGGKGTVVDGNNTTTTNAGDMAIDGEGSVGLEVNGDNGNVTNNGDTTVSGEGSAGTVINGDNGAVTNEGDTIVSGGGSGTVITGDNGTVNNNGDTTVSGEGSTGIVINGNNSSVVQTGDLTVTGGGMGISISGDNSDVVLSGDMLVTGGATGVSVVGTDNYTSNDGNITVRDVNSVGILVEGLNAGLVNRGDVHVTNYGTGASLSGDGFNVVLDGTVTAEVLDNRASATGVQISGNNGTLQITGDVKVLDVTMGIPDVENSPVLYGVHVTGDSNQVIIDGTITKDYQGSVASRSPSTVQAGLRVDGSNNTLRINGGVNYSALWERVPGYSANEHGDHATFTVNGNGNDIVIDGESNFSVSGYNNKLGHYIGRVRGKDNNLIFTENSVINIGMPQREQDDEHHSGYGIIIQRSGNTVILNGEVNGDVILQEGIVSGGNSLNNGTINLNSKFTNSIGAAVLSGYNIVNNGIIDIASFSTPFFSGLANLGVGLGKLYLGGEVAGLSGTISTTNTADGHIKIAGAGTYAMSSQSGHQLNEGTITVDGMQLHMDENLEPDGTKTLFKPESATLKHMALRGVGMHLSLRGTMVNTGTIEVKNSGSGMFAMGTSVATNQGTINLESDGSHDEHGWMYAMSATENGVAINDTGGVININTDLGQAFYTAGNGKVFNYGEVNFNGSAIGSGDPNWGQNVNVSNAIIISDNALTSAGDQLTLDDANGYFLLVPEVISAGDVDLSTSLAGVGILHNTGTLNVSDNGLLEVSTLNNTGTIIAEGPIVSRTSVFNQAGGIITNAAEASSSTGTALIVVDNGGNVNLAPLTNPLVNQGIVHATNGYSALFLDEHNSNFRWAFNLDGGKIIGENPGAPLIFVGRGFHFYNAGEISVQGDNATAISTTITGYALNVVNDGVINVGTEEGKSSGTNGTGLTGIEVNAGGGRVYNNTGGVINVWADDSWAFRRNHANARIVNNGTVNLMCDSGCEIFAPGSTGYDGGDFGAPSLPSMPDVPGASLVSNYVIGTNADGSAGKLSGKNLHIDGSVTVDTGFVAGTSDRHVIFTDVFKADSVSGEENIGSTTVVWNASASKNVDGNVDVTMTKNDYASVATDMSVGSVAAALDKGYTNNALFSSLNVSSASALNKALKQVSGAQAKSLNREARVLGHRFSQLAQTAPQVTDSGLSFNVVARGDKRAEMDNKVSYDMMSLAQRFDTQFGEVTASYGIARLQGKGGNQGNRAGDNGLTGGYSQFLGLGHSLPLSEESRWNNLLRWDVHELDSSRSLSFEGTSRVAKSKGRQQHLSFRSEGVKDLVVNESLTVSPFAGMKLRHHITDGYSERGAGEFNLTTNSYSETSADAVGGMRISYAGVDGWGAQATLEAGPNLGFSQSARKASLQGMQGQQFRIDDGKRGGGVNSQLSAGVNYHKDNLAFGAQAYQWKEDGASDNGFTLSVSRSF